MSEHEYTKQDEAEKDQKWNVCSDCWGHLVLDFKYVQVPDMERKQKRFYLHCMTIGCTCNGFVSKRYVEQSESRGHGEELAARTALRGSFLPAKSDQVLLKELGIR
jgi:hypothetical protein